MKIKYRVSVPSIGSIERKYINDALKRNEISGFFGSYINKFEKNFSDFCGCKYAVSVNSGTTAIHLGLLAVGIKKNDEVIVSSLTNMATIFAILYIGAKPILIDIEDKTFNIDTKLIENKITKRTKAILIVHLFGHPVDVKKIMELKKKYNLKIIEDCAEAHGAKYFKKKVGSFGDAGCFSFYANKIITTGEGGMVTFSKKVYFDKAKNLKELAFGRKDKFMHADIGYNYRMTNIQAALGLAQMKRINYFINKKIKISKWYNKYLNTDKIILPYTKKNYKNVFWMYCVGLKGKNKKKRLNIRKKLSSFGIETREMFIPANLQKIFLRKKLFKKNECPKANRVSSSTFYLPSGYELKEKDVKYISNKLNNLL